MFESGHWREMASCAVLRTIGSKKLPPEARRMRISPVGVVDVDVAAVRVVEKLQLSLIYLCLTRG